MAARTGYVLRFAGLGRGQRERHEWISSTIGFYRGLDVSLHIRQLENGLERPCSRWDENLPWLFQRLPKPKIRGNIGRIRGWGTWIRTSACGPEIGTSGEGR